MAQLEAIYGEVQRRCRKLKASGGLSITADEFLTLSFSHHMEILSGTDTLEEEFFYIRAAAKYKERPQRQDSPARSAFPATPPATRLSVWLRC